jgi:hypothetical protein
MREDDRNSDAFVDKLEVVPVDAESWHRSDRTRAALREAVRPVCGIRPGTRLATSRRNGAQKMY